MPPSAVMIQRRRESINKKIPVSLCALILASCTSSYPSVSNVNTRNDTVQLTFSWWGNDDRNEYTLEAIRRFEEKYPGIDVRCSYTEWSGYQVRNNVRMASGRECDVMQINFAWIDQYSPDGKGYYDIKQLTDVVDLTTIDSSMLDYGMKENRLNALPIAMNAQTVYINRTLYESYGLDVPVTWSDFLDAAKAMDGKVYPVSMIPKSAWLFCIAYAEQARGHSVFDEEGRLTFTAEDFKVMIEFYCMLVEEKVMPQMEYGDDYELSSGKTAGVVAWLSDAENECAAAIENGYDIVTAPYTSMSGEPGHGWYVKPATMYAVSDNTEHPLEAGMLLNFLINSSEMAELQGLEKGVPLSSPARDTLEGLGMLDGIQYDAFERMEEPALISKMRPVMENTDVIRYFQEACNEVLFDKSTAEEQGEVLCRKIKEISG